MYKAFVFLLLMGTWLILSGLFDAFHITLGLISCTIVTLMSEDLLFSDRSRSAGERVSELIRLPSYLGWLLWQIILANMHVIRLALHPDGAKEIKPRMVRIKTPLKSDFARYMLANSITLTPGTVTVKVEGDELLVHAISKVAADGLDGAMDEQIARIYEPELLEEKSKQSGGA